MGAEMTCKDAFPLIAFGILLPTLDIFTDIKFAMRLFSKGHPKFAWSMLAPVIISFSFMTLHWLRMESTIKKRLKSLPFLIMQVWPQVQVLKIIKMGCCDKNPQWRQRKESMERDITSLGKNFENIFSMILQHNIFQNHSWKQYLRSIFC